MSSLSAFFYDKLLAQAEEACLIEWRRDLLKNTHGDILEIGAGTGANVEFYPAKIQTLVLSEPDRHMRKQMEKKIITDKRNISITADTADRIDAENESYDFVVTSLVCCSVRHLEDMLFEIRRVLKSKGRFIFIEHVAAPKSTQRRVWQDLMNPFWRKLAGNCHLNRETESAILAAGFAILEIKRESMRTAMPLVRPTIRGIAVKC